MSRKKSVGRTSLLPPLWEKEGPLKREEVQCPICWSILIEPVTMPCRHALCLVCFRKHVEETSLQCPCCRMRLSVWSRKAFKDNQLVDTQLWSRIQREFPKLVDTRLCGEDSQVLEPLDLISVEEKSSTDANSNVVGNEEDTGEQDEDYFPIGSGVIDGVFSTSKGDIKRELEAMVKQHQDDIENERRQEEIASSQLIKQLQEAGEVIQPVNPSVIEADLEIAKKLSEQFEEESKAKANPSIIEADLEIAKKLSEQFEEENKAKRLAEINASRKMFVMPAQPQSSQNRSASSSRIEGWINNSQSHAFVRPLSGNSSCLNNLQTPKKRASTSTISSGSEKKLRSSRRDSYHGSAHRTRSASKTSEQSVKPGNSILTYLSPNSTSTSSERPSPEVSSCQFGLKQVNLNAQSFENKKPESPEYFGSAFSPNSPRNKSLMIPRKTVVYSTPLQHERLMKNAAEYISLSKNIEREISTPDSISSEVNTHFRPIKSAPKTPPKRLLDGSYLPDPPLVRSLAAKGTFPSAPSFTYVPIEAQTKSPGKICLDGKRNSNDSGRGSSSPEQPMGNNVTTPPIPKLVHFLSIPAKGSLSLQAPVISPEGLRKTSNITSTLPRALTFRFSPIKKTYNSVIIKQEPTDEVATATVTSPLKSNENENSTVRIKQEKDTASCSFVHDENDEAESENMTLNKMDHSKQTDIKKLQQEPQTSIKREREAVDLDAVSDKEDDFDVDEASLSLILQESASVPDIKPGTPVLKIIESEQEKEFRRIQERARQVEADMKYAEKLQKMLDQGKNVAVPKSYSLRSWITRNSL